MDLHSEFLSRKRAANLLGVSSKTLERLASEGNGPPYVRIALRRVVYERGDLVNWARERKYKSHAHEMVKNEASSSGTDR
jgi:predicted DNA-binding transcriptional regulator AlpA